MSDFLLTFSRDAWSKFVPQLSRVSLSLPPHLFVAQHIHLKANGLQKPWRLTDGVVWISRLVFVDHQDPVIALFWNPPRLDKFQVESSPRVHEDGRSR